MPTCDVLLATYNGEAFLTDLLNSLLAQTDSDFRLLVRDDGSRDTTLAILHTYAPRFGGRLLLIGDGRPTGDPTRNFELLMQASTADHVLFCDQDDIWLPNRVVASQRMLSEGEGLHGATTPIFVFNDLIPVNRNLNRLADSFWAFRKIDPSMARNLPMSLIASPILGCSSGINRALLKRALPIHPQAAHHDWWTLHVAILFGQVFWSAEKTVLYRLHGGNASNQKRVSLLDYARTRGPIARVRNGLARKARHAGALWENYHTMVSQTPARLLADLAQIQHRGFIGRRVTLLKWGLIYPDLRRNVAFFLAL